MGHADFIENLGGGTAVAAWLSEASGERVDREAVYKWRERDLIPWKWRPFLLGMAREKGRVPPEGFLPGIAA